MGRRISVRRHRKQDGTWVQAHQRLIADAPDDPQEPLTLERENLSQLLEEGPKLPDRQTNIRSLNRIILDDYHKDSILEDISDYLKESDLKEFAAIVGVGSTVGVGAAIALGASIALPIVAIPTAIAAAPFLSMFAAKGLRHTLLRRKTSQVSGAKISKREMDRIASFYPTDKKPEMPKGKKEVSNRGSYSETDSVLERYDYKTNVSNLTEITLRSNGTGMIRHPMKHKDVVIKFFPGVDLSQDSFPFQFYAPGANLQQANFSKTEFRGGVNWDGSDLRGINLKGARFPNPSNMVNADLRGADISNVDLSKVNLLGADLRGANLAGSTLPYDLRGVGLDDEHFRMIEDSLDDYVYDSVPLGDAAKHLGISDERLEFLVMSGAIKVRENRTKSLVQKDFDVDEHHVDAWELRKAAKILATAA